MLRAVSKRPPGPKRLPLIGSLPALSRDPLAFMLELGRSYGDIAYTTIGRTALYMINDPLLIEEVLMGRHRECTKDLGARELMALVGNGLLTSEGDFWKRQRKLASPPLAPKRIAGYADTMVACAERECGTFRAEEVRDIHADMMRLTLEIVGKTLLGVDTGREAASISEIVHVAMDYFDKQFWTWHGILPKWISTKERRAFRLAVRELDRIIYAIIARGRARGEEADDLLSRLANARDDSGAPMSDEQLRDEAVTMLLAGHETTALVLSYAVYMLSQNAAVAERARAEVDAVLGSRPAVVGDLPQLKLVDAVVRETMRLYPPAFAIGREVATPFELGGYTLPKGAQLTIAPYVIQRDARFFPDPERFQPERWLTPREPALPRFAYFPFGGGPRVCIGNHFAMMEATLVLATMLQQLELTVVPGYRLALSPSVTLRPAGPIPVLVRRRIPAPTPRRSPWSLHAPAAALEG
jgi:cytochrome P450